MRYLKKTIYYILFKYFFISKVISRISLNFLGHHRDQIAHWWMTFVTIACKWLLGEDCDENVYKKIEMIPEPLASLNDTLPKSIVAAFVARKNYLSKDVNIKPKNILEQLNYASHLLADSLTLTSCKKREDLVLVSRFSAVCKTGGFR